MFRTRLPRWMAAFWGFVVYMPVGMNYAAFVLLLATLLAGGDLRGRAQRMRQNPMWWPIMAYVAWTLLVLALRPHYRETPNDLFHGLRIAATMLMALALTREEAIWALRAFLLTTVLGLVAIAIHVTIGLPDVQLWRAIVVMQGNKSINNALLFALVGAVAAVIGLAHLHDLRRWHWAGPAFAATVVMAVLVSVVLPSRTSLLAMLACIFAACFHQWRSHPKGLAVALVAACVVAALGVWQMPQSIKNKFELGVQELEEAQAGVASEASWVSRYYMYRETARMMLDAPVAGLGIGAWTSEWKRRAPKVIDYKNMPHNDYLWMGSQGGIPGLLSLLGIMLAGVWVAWRRADLTGRIGFVAVLTMLIAANLNSAMRDAQIGLSLLWIVFLCLRLVREEGSPWRGVFPPRLGGLLVSGGPPPARPL
ncbi:O-antigen ligase family protein [Variovorax dokdonensis]|uniref:O-antigen ligase family protein n=1 Tax=Variovorax dokdonensis TaxID=344883 RepID=A0ABT7NF27_9BURK|nr:O-antigen ligase family protein [Variovorax dokdonensis]MDM0046542.1 O-antigen ligase family protein [Variovorax dokdonensis]